MKKITRVNNLSAIFCYIAKLKEFVKRGIRNHGIVE